MVYAAIGAAVAVLVVFVQVWWARRVLTLLSAIAHSTEAGRNYLAKADAPTLDPGQPLIKVSRTRSPR